MPRILGKLLGSADKDKADIVLLGSIARRESTVASDCDYFVLQHGASPITTRQLIRAARRARESTGLNKPGAQGVFGEVVIAANLYECIGLDVDSNANMTRRILLLTESESVWGNARRNVIDNILSRYCADYLPPERSGDSPARIPRYLLNDLIRFWRTMAVDFGTKRWRTNNDESYLRLAKLRITRKVLFAGPLATLLLVPKRTRTTGELQEYLTKWLNIPPLAQLASVTELVSDRSKDAMKQLLVQYDRFIDLISDDKRRDILGARCDKNGHHNMLKDECRSIGDTVEKSLETLFWDDDLFYEMLRSYAVF